MEENQLNKMTRLEKCIALKDKGYIYAPETGKIYGVRGNEITGKRKGYIVLQNHKPDFPLQAHHFAWYWVYGNVDFIELDHKDTDKTNNRISNLRISNRVQQNQNTNAKGFTWCKKNNKWKSRITFEGKTISLGYFNREEEARQAYLNAKKIYHKI